MKELSELGVSQTPWSADDWSEAEHGEYDVRIRDANDNEIAQPLSTFDDARLIAAAPNMYKELYDDWRFCKWLVASKKRWLVERAQKRMKMIEAALAKAAGEEVEK